MTSEDLLTTQELADALRVTVRTIQRYQSAGKIQPELTLPGGQHRWNEQKVRDQMRALRATDT